MILMDDTSSRYGRAFLDLSASIYPGYHPGTGIGSVIVAEANGRFYEPAPERNFPLGVSAELKF